MRLSAQALGVTFEEFVRLDTARTLTIAGTSILYTITAVALLFIVFFVLGSYFEEYPIAWWQWLLFAIGSLVNAPPFAILVLLGRVGIPDSALILLFVHLLLGAFYGWLLWVLFLHDHLANTCERRGSA